MAKSARIQQIPQSATVKIADLASELIRSGRDVLDFSAGRASEHTPEFIIRAASEAMFSGDTHQTPARGKLAYLEACSRKLRRDNGLSVHPEREIIATMGCKHGLILTLLATLDPGDEVLVEDPAFVSYGPVIRLCGITAIPVSLRRENTWRWDPEELQTHITKRTRALLFCSPHNPAGIVHSREDLNDIANIAIEHNLLVIADETYERLTWNENRHVCIASLPGMKDRTMGLMGVTKSFSMGGWRVGFAYGPAPIISAMTTVQQHANTCVGAFVQTAAATAFDHTHEVQELWNDWQKRCEYVTSELNKIAGLSCEMPEGGFYAWADCSETGYSSSSLTESLLRECGVALVPGAAFGSGGEGFLRMTCVKSWEDIREGISRIQSYLDS